MALTKRGSVWHYDFVVRGRRYQGSTYESNKRSAEKFTAKMRSQIQYGDATVDAKRTTLADALDEYSEFLEGRSSYKTVLGHKKALISGLGRRVMLDDLTSSDIDKYCRDRQDDVSTTTINREMQTLRACILRSSDVHGALTPKIKFSKILFAEPDKRVRWLTDEERDRLYKKLPEYMRLPVEFSLATGLRKSNVFGMRWGQVRWSSSTMVFHVKSRRPGGKVLTLPITEEIEAILLEAQSVANDCEYVFTRSGRQIKDATRAWRRALADAKIENFRWHDLRHTAASGWVQNDVPLEVVQDLLGHSSILTTSRYAHHKLSAKADAMKSVRVRTKSPAG